MAHSQPPARSFVVTSDLKSPFLQPEPPQADKFNWLIGEGEMARRVRNYDWASTPLGDVDQWPRALKQLLNQCLASQFPMYIWWGESLINIYNDAYIELAGPLKHPKFFARPAKEMWPEIWPTLQGFIDQVSATKKPLLHEDTPMSLQRGKDTDDAYFSFSFGPAIDADGVVRGIHCTCHETTAKVVAERALIDAHTHTELARKELYQFFMQAPIPLVILTGAEHRFYLANAPYERLVGRKVTGKTVLEAFTQDEVGHFLPLLDGVFHTGVPYVGSELPLNIPDENGVIQNHFVNLGYYPFLDETGTIKGILAFVADVTETVLSRADLEVTVSQLTQERALRDQFVMALTHDLRTPLTAAKMGAQLVERKLSDPGLNKYLSRVVQNIDRTDSMIQDLLDANAIKGGEELSIERQDCHLNEITMSVLEQLTSIHGERFVFQADKDIYGFWDCSNLRRVIENLAGNAVKYGDSQSPITISLEQKPDAVEIAVHNEGEPISPEDQTVIFEHTKRTRAAKISGHKGWGIGLTLVKGIVQAHGGKALVESAPEKGTTFRIILPKVTGTAH